MPLDDPRFNPFRAPENQESAKHILSEDDDYLISEKAILCRQSVTLPPVCIRYGETEDVLPTVTVLRRLTGQTVARVVLSAAILLILPIWVAIDNTPIFRSDLLNALSAIFLLTLFGIIVWWSAKHGMDSVNVTWYTCGRYRRRVRWNKGIVRTVFFCAAVALGVLAVRWAQSYQPLVFFLLAAGIMSMGYDPEIRLQLVGRSLDAYVLQGHTAAFCEAVTQYQTGLWDRAITPGAVGSPEAVDLHP